MFLYSGFSLNNLGQYDACNDMEGTKYLLIMIYPFPVMGMALCGPEVCTIEDYEKMLNGQFALSSVMPDIHALRSNLTASINFPMIFPKEYIDDNFEDYSAGVILMILFISIVATVCIIATSVDFYMSTVTKNQGKQPNSVPIVIKYLLCFSFMTNFQKLFTSRSQEKLGKRDTLDILNGVRVMSIGWVIYGHVIFFSWTQGVLVNASDIINFLKGPTTVVPLSGTYAVDSFFWLSGLLVGYLLILEINNSKKMNWPMVYIHRYLRIIPLYMFVLLFFWALQKHIGGGPLWFEGDNINAGCKNHWWTNLLFVNNVVPDWKGSSCLNQSWYLANDMQFFILTPPILYIYHKYNKYFGWAVLWALTGISILVTGLIAHHFTLNAMPTAQINGINYFQYYYNKPYCRVAPYIMGIITGLVIYAYRAYKDKKNYYDPVSIWIGNKLEDPLIRYVFGFIGLSLISILVWVQYDTLEYPGTLMEYSHWSHSQNEAFVTLCRPLFGLGLTLLLLPSLLGHFNFITWVLSWDIWTPLARLTFAVYLIHVNVIVICYGSQKASYMLDDFTVVKDTIFYFVVCYILALPFVLMIEMPALAVEKMAFLRARAKPNVEQENKSVLLLPVEGKKEAN
ncbi:unnamed protein product [Blepharisma stoltei]|uniref:Acyltransferase 3 domain-containing protein n=1 Tax=Blepharisma stoltei TaxID=1481888 RepID=A0AAU9K2Y3_9CILI|nr:unnamed protein product [Blepharisma stoltei]